MCIEKIKNYVHEHKYEIIGGTIFVGALVGTVVLGNALEQHRLNRAVLKAMKPFGPKKDLGKNLKVDFTKLANGCDHVLTVKANDGYHFTTTNIFNDPMAKLVADGGVSENSDIIGLIVFSNPT